MDRRQAESLPPYAHENCAERVLVIITVCLFVATIVVSLRFYVRLVIIKKFGPDDWTLAAALIVTIGAATVMAVSTKFGLGSHAYLLSTPKMSKFLKLVWIGSIGYCFSITLMKAVFLLQYRRIFPLPNFQRLCNISLGFLVVWAMTGTLGAMLICLPIERNWDALASTKCVGRMYFWEAYAIIHIITDVLILVMPLPVLKTLPLPRVQKWVLLAVFCLGFCTCAISVIRITTLRSSLMETDVTWTMPTTVLWSMAEVLCAIICVCIPTLRPLVTRLCGLWRRTFLEANCERTSTRAWSIATCVA
ncbi:uncharacterized protein PAC_01252 [Phialocephala subalpina]|uniref:Rhodopsin domain-containing protein n=1 Tax=Phialocephala subalpina TaxID=576137 RepID=A0A1L7WF24_9HELO|nr:uncharacterized protein PAC_01252 [Phialocephala subalpina]